MDVEVYAACDKAIREMNRSNLRAFGQLKGRLKENKGEAGLIRAVTGVYRDSAKKARRHFLEVAAEAYIIALMMCGTEPGKAHRMADKAITGGWMDGILTVSDPVTMYRFDTETERKAQRLTETLAALTDGGKQIGKPVTSPETEINRALKAWSGQLAQYAINVTDYAMKLAYEDAGIQGGFWRSKKDKGVCLECRRRNGKWFPLKEVPKKHWQCRCWLEPGEKPE